MHPVGISGLLLAALLTYCMLDDREQDDGAIPVSHVLAKMVMFWVALSLWRAVLDNGDVWRSRMRALLPRPPVRACTADVGIVDALPAELLPHLLSAGCLTAADLASCAAACSTLAGIVRDHAYDALIWEPVCRARWRTKAYDPLLVYPAALVEGLQSWRERFQWAERDGARQLATGTDVCKVAAWSVDFGGGRAYTIAPFPYRTDGEYVSPTFAGGQTRRWSVKAARHGNLVLVDGIPDVRISRRSDWGWELSNHMWVARSVAHHAQPQQRSAFDALFGPDGPCHHADGACGEFMWSML